MNVLGLSMSLRVVGFFLALCLARNVQAANFEVMLCVDPSDRGIAVSTTAAVASLTKLLDGPVSMTEQTDLKDALRITRTGEKQMLMGPAHVIASAIVHGYKPLSVSGTELRYALVVRTNISKNEQLRGARLYLPQQDSLRSYVVKGLLDRTGVSPKELKSLEYHKTSGAGLIAIDLGMADATVSTLDEAQAWIKLNPNRAQILQISEAIPGGFSIAVHNSTPDATIEKLTRWAEKISSVLPNLGPQRKASPSDIERLRYVASLGIFTPSALANANVINAKQLAQLIEKQPDLIVADTRSAKEYQRERIERAISAPYVEKSLKEKDFDSSLDDFTAIAKLDHSKPIVFLCNGPECWKSYKAAHQAILMGFQTVYWFRGGMPEWREAGMPTVKSAL